VPNVEIELRLSLRTTAACFVLGSLLNNLTAAYREWSYWMVPAAAVLLLLAMVLSALHVLDEGWGRRLAATTMCALSVLQLLDILLRRLPALLDGR
jgi:hypothetical protein